MNKPENPAWQGATQVATARLQTIDRALAKLEALVSDDNSPSQQSGSQPKADADSPPNRSAQMRQESKKEIIHKGPHPVPAPSLRALEAFLESTDQKRYMPKAA